MTTTETPLRYKRSLRVKHTPFKSLTNRLTKLSPSHLNNALGGSDKHYNRIRKKKQLSDIVSLNYSTVNKVSLTYNANTSKELLLLNSLSKNKSISPNNYILNPKKTLSLLNNPKKRRCFLCRTASSKLVSTNGCPHFFCCVCIQQLFDKNFLIKENSFKCPIIPCIGHIDQEALKLSFLLKDSISEKSLTGDSCNNNTDNADPIRIYNRTTKLSIGTHSTSYNHNAFVFFMKNKGRYCRNCFSDKLYSPVDKRMFVCLNCSRRFCQKCYRYCEDTHFDANYVNHCPILDGQCRRKRRTTLKEKMKAFLLEVLCLVIGWLVLLVGHAINIKQYVLAFKRKKLKIGLVLTWVLVCICYVVIPLLVTVEVCLFTMMLPYFSIILLLFDGFNKKRPVKV